MLYLVGENLDKTRAHYQAETGKIVQLMRGIYVDSADDIVLYHFATPGHFEILAYAEEDPDRSDHAARIWTGAPADRRLKKRMAAEVEIPDDGSFMASLGIHMEEESEG